MLHTPVLLLIFNRPDTTEKVIEAIRLYKPRQLFIAADGPRKGREDDIVKTTEARNIALQKVDWECEVKTLFQEDNLGCGIAPATAISWFFNQVEEGIILEDDCLPTLGFFFYCGELLNHYRNNEQVMHISGNNFQFGKKWGRGSYYFSHYINAWGWATWRRAWQYYDFELKGSTPGKIDRLLSENLSSKDERRFWKAHFEEVKDGKRKDIWDYQWVYTIWKQNGLAVIPNVNLVTNIGFGSDATHTFNQEAIVANNPAYELEQIKHPESSKVFLKADRRLFRICHKPKLSLRDRAYLVKKRIKKLIEAPKILLSQKLW
jgi:hypothetical protein